MFGLYVKRFNKVSAICSMVSGLVASLTLAIASGFNSGNAPLFGIIATGISFAVGFIAMIVTKPHTDTTEFFSA